MTTIAYDGITLCTDSLISSNGMAFGTGQKLFHLRGGAVLAICGDMCVGHDVMLWLDGRADRPALSADDSFGAILIEPDGSAWDFGKNLRRFPACIPWAGGSGELVAMTAMRCGKSAREAVEIACEVDLCSRGPVQEWSHELR